MEKSDRSDNAAAADVRRDKLDRLDGCLMWALGVPVVLIVTAGLLSVVWGWGTTGRAGLVAKGIASVVIVAGVGLATWKVLGVRRK